MKRIFFGAAIAFLMTTIISGCQKNLDNKEEIISGPTLQCEINDETKTYIDGASVKWNENDIIYVTLPDSSKTKKQYKCTDGIGTKRGIFSFAEKEGDAYENGTKVIAYTKSKGFDYFHVDYKWYFDIPTTPSLSYSANKEKMVIPMRGEGIVGGVITFEHLVSMMCFEIKNETEEDINITSIEIDADQLFIWRLGVNHPAATLVEYGPSSSDVIKSTGNEIIEKGKTKNFYYVINPKAYANLKVTIKDSENNTYEFMKASSTTFVKGTMHKFATLLNDSTKKVAWYQASIDGGEYQDYYLELGFPSTPSTSIAIKSLTSAIIAPTPADMAKILAEVDKLSSPISVNLTEMTSVGSVWNYDFKTTKVSDFYFPSSVTKIHNHSHFVANINMKLHINKNITTIAQPQLQGRSSMSAECGYYVDSDNTVYQSSADHQLLLSKSGKTLFELLPCESYVLPEGIDTLAWYACSNNFYTTLTLPATLKYMARENLGYNNVNDHTYIFKSTNPPALGSTTALSLDSNRTGYLVVDTGDKGQDSISVKAYEAAYSSIIPSTWSIIPKKDYIEPTKSTKATISDLKQNSDYSSDLW